MKIAIVGSAPSSRLLAPYQDKEWEIWSCSSGNAGALPRFDLWFELHSLDRLSEDKDYTAYLVWLKSQKVYLQKADQQFPQSITYPLAEMIERFGQYNFTSTVAYMLALAIVRKPSMIGVFGVDMAATDEYGYQRSGCQFFIAEAIKARIEVHVPPQSDLMQPPNLYGFVESTRKWQKLWARRNELIGRIGDVSQQKATLQREEDHLRGALENLEYIRATWNEIE